MKVIKSYKSHFHQLPLEEASLIERWIALIMSLDLKSNEIVKFLIKILFLSLPDLFFKKVTLFSVCWRRFLSSAVVKKVKERKLSIELKKEY